MAHKITRVSPERVDFDPPLTGRAPKRSLPPEKFGVTDPAIALVEGNEFEKGVASCEITAFGPALRADTGPVPEIDHNPYNFVAFADKQPWPALATPPGHDDFQGLNGSLEFEAETLTPSCVPSGFPFAAGDEKPGGGTYTEEEIRQIPRQFCTLLDARARNRYAIPGSALKGAARAAVEAIANSRLGVADTSKLGRQVYRRRVFKCGRLRSKPNGDWEVEEIVPSRDGYGQVAADNLAGLLAWFRAGKPKHRQFDLTDRKSVV